MNLVIMCLQAVLYEFQTVHARVVKYDGRRMNLIMSLQAVLCEFQTVHVRIAKM